MYKTTIGIHAIKDAAISSGNLDVYWPCICASAEDKTSLFLSVFTIIGHINSLYAKKEAKLQRATIQQRVSGDQIYQNVRPPYQPSNLAASSKSFGSPLNACRNKNVPKAVTIPGNTNANIVFNIFNLLTIKYCGIIKI